MIMEKKDEKVGDEAESVEISGEETTAGAGAASGAGRAGDANQAGAISEDVKREKPEADAGSGECSHRMVETSRQPGVMKHPFATHGPPPEGEEEKEKVPESGLGEAIKGKITDGENISIAFVLGVLIIVAVLFIGLMFAVQRRQIEELEARVESIESHLAEN